MWEPVGGGTDVGGRRDLACVQDTRCGGRCNRAGRLGNTAGIVWIRPTGGVYKGAGVRVSRQSPGRPPSRALTADNPPLAPFREPAVSPIPPTAAAVTRSLP